MPRQRGLLLPAGRAELAQTAMDDANVIQDFENYADSSRPFHHADHVRLAFAYLQKFPTLQALDKFSTALKRFAEARGKTQLYHETITYTYFFLIHERMACAASQGWEEFAQRNPDLLVWKGGVLERYYTQGTLHSALAKKVFVMPDKGLG